MRIILSDFISLDGVVQAPGGKDEDTDGGFQHGGWSMPFFDPEAMGSAIDEVMERTDALLFGRRTWDVHGRGLAGAERRSVRRPDERDPEVRRVAHAVGRRGVVALEQHDAPRGGGGDAIEAIRSLRASGGDGGLQVWGSASLARQLVENDLVDEYRLMLEPILLGGGKSIFPSDGLARPLRARVGDAGEDRRAHLRLPPGGRAGGASVPAGATGRRVTVPP